MVTDKIKELSDKVDKIVADIYEYIKHAEEKAFAAEETIRFSAACQAEQIKTIINGRTDNLRRFFEEAIRMQTEIIRDTYESLISELKATYENEIKMRETENLRLFNEKRETLISSYENQINNLKVSMENDFQVRMQKSYLESKGEFDKIFQDEINKHEKQVNNIREDYARKAEIAKEDLRQYYEKEMSKQADELKKYYDAEMQRRTEEAYINGKTDTEAWHDDIVRQKLDVQAQYFDGEIQKAREVVKKELYEEMDEAARRNEEELKLFQDYYEEKIRPFKKLINFHDKTDKRIKDIQRRINNKIKKTFASSDKSGESEK